MSFHLTAKQTEANHLLGAGQTHSMLFGGSRSGKTFLIVRAYCIRSMKYEASRQAMLRFRFTDIRSSIVADTFPKVMRLCFPEVKYQLLKSEWVAKFPNGSEIWFGGLDDKERTEKILGQEHCGIFLNECSQIPWGARNIAMTRLAQNCGARLRMDYDCNPPNQGHWTYKLFVQHVSPDSGEAVPGPENYAAMLLNPQDNAENLPEGYIKQLEGLPERLRKRFLRGEFLPVAENALWNIEQIDKHRILDGKQEDYLRIVIGVDPSGADEDHPERDEIGIVVAGLRKDGVCEILEDLTVHAGPKVWGEVAASAYKRHQADKVVGEENYGGAMVKFTVQTAAPYIPYKSVTASRGKVVRAEPVAALYEQGMVKHAGYFPELEEELSAFTTTGYQGDRSPNRADALVWAITELFPGAIHGIYERSLPRREKSFPDYAVVEPAGASENDGLFS